MTADNSATISVRSLSPFGERVGVRGIQNYREILGRVLINPAR
jgi:hypothetical protein